MTCLEILFVVPKVVPQFTAGPLNLDLWLNSGLGLTLCLFIYLKNQYSLFTLLSYNHVVSYYPCSPKGAWVGAEGSVELAATGEQGLFDILL